MIEKLFRSEYKDDPLLSEADNDMANLLYFLPVGVKQRRSSVLPYSTCSLIASVVRIRVSQRC